MNVGTVGLMTIALIVGVILLVLALTGNVGLGLAALLIPDAVVPSGITPELPMMLGGNPANATLPTPPGNAPGGGAWNNNPASGQGQNPSGGNTNTSPFVGGNWRG